MAAEAPPGTPGGAAPLQRFAAALAAAEAQLQEPGSADERIQKVAQTLPVLNAAAKAARDG